ncbi:MAG: VWA domain-containing protein [Microcoleus sp. PH2017_01_SCD_O_A]|uniref:vWA domain-containing protein n=1 Tax=unclassified Microcoleus TaxID=2642155 RepID=UPI001E163138|nr:MULTISPECIES: VWA domain-containing protein [unclassified Microcoleus]MCC3418086.1 VWA domain-containing protein [Microcoleus sp. PH2017_07_MST_O_A]MCC3508988.1 VWA domain-containing protein [Microcoleus sp. PH2017_17_BER_D_A]TAG66345.1 MAG: VWA domain-containing protein [Oscillatoriales cyanobacterium]MCC3425361.1 VWA domain-containing protein [Microcoleus sp. PH2017_01_SCD_O_A]MCC3456586.1 VWA domain-containing protein [Microcoleus sp. PH2017_08_TRC_O_A]
MARQAKQSSQVKSSSSQAASNNRTKFTLYNFAGNEKAFYLVDRLNLERTPGDIPEKSVAHSIIIIDRSGSMYSDLKPLKETLVKLLTLDEYNNYQLIVSLISYADNGDVICHFQRIPIQEVTKIDSQYIKQIKNIQTAGCTCISQSMQLAKSLVKAGEVTAINLHTDGYANDPSPNAEAAKLAEICNELKDMDVFANTISYASADFKLLSKIANTLSGNCIRAGEVKMVYDALYDSTKLLGDSVAPPLEEPLIKEYDYQVFVSKTGKKISGSSSTLKICGLKADDAGLFYKYQQVTKDEYDKLEVPVAQTDESVFAFAKANLADGNLNTAKYALASTFDATLTEKHAKALTNAQIAEFTEDLEQAVFAPDVLQNHEIGDRVKVSDKISLLELIEILEENSNSIIINLKHLQENYQRKGLKRVEGKRDENGNLVKPWLKTEFLDGGEYVRMGSFAINQNTATINMLITRKVKLVKVEDGSAIAEVAGILVTDLNTFNNYTIVSDGEVNIKSLRTKISSKAVFDLLKKCGVLQQYGSPAGDFDFHSEYDINLDSLPLVPFDGRYGSLDGVFEELANIKILSSILSAHLKEASESYTAQQLEELKQHYLSKSLYLNFPTTTEYTELKSAIANGTVDSRVSYKIDIGSKNILNFAKLHSANKFLDRLYEVYHKNTGEKLAKPTFHITLDEPVVFAHKTVSSRTKITKVDDLMKQIFDDFLGLENNGIVSATLAKVGADSLLRLLQAKWQEEDVKRDEFVAALTRANEQLETYAEKVYAEKVSPLVFYIGSTGLIPDEMEAKAATAEEINAKYGNLQFSKDEQEGMFFEVGDCIISVYAKNEYFTVGK